MVSVKFIKISLFAITALTWIGVGLMIATLIADVKAPTGPSLASMNTSMQPYVRCLLGENPPPGWPYPTGSVVLQSTVEQSQPSTTIPKQALFETFMQSIKGSL